MPFTLVKRRGYVRRNGVPALTLVQCRKTLVTNKIVEKAQSMPLGSDNDEP